MIPKLSDDSLVGYNLIFYGSYRIWTDPPMKTQVMEESDK